MDGEAGAAAPVPWRAGNWPHAPGHFEGELHAGPFRPAAALRQQQTFDPSRWCMLQVEFASPLSKSSADRYGTRKERRVRLATVLRMNTVHARPF